MESVLVTKMRENIFKQKDRTHRSGLASILVKKSPPMGYRELSNLFKTMSVSTLKYCLYDEMLNTPLQLFAGCCSKPSAWIVTKRSDYSLIKN